MTRLALEFSPNLRYKELTHRSDTYRNGFVWTPAATMYRWEKRRMAKVSRRNGKEIIAEYGDTGPDLELAALMELWVAYLLFLEDWEFAKVFSEFARPACDGPGYCSICDATVSELKANGLE